MVLLDNNRKNPADADAIAAHHHGCVLAVVIKKCRGERHGIPGAELEDVADFDRPLDRERARAVRRGVT